MVGARSDQVRLITLVNKGRPISSSKVVPNIENGENKQSIKQSLKRKKIID